MIWTFIPALPEMIRFGMIKYSHKEIEITDLSSGLFSSILSFGQMVAPIFGSYMTEITNFRICVDIVGLLQIGFFIIYFIYGNETEPIFSNISKTTDDLSTSISDTDSCQESLNLKNTNSRINYSFKLHQV